MDRHIDGIPVPRGLVCVVAVLAIGPTTLRIAFDDGLTGELDLNDYVTWTGVFAPVKADPARFAEVFVDPEAHTVAWPGDIDLDSEALHARIS